MEVFLRFYTYLTDLITKSDKKEGRLKDKSNLMNLLEKSFKIYKIRDELYKDNDKFKQRVTILINEREIKFCLV
jgi:hypothetical protein